MSGRCPPEDTHPPWQAHPPRQTFPWETPWADIHLLGRHTHRGQTPASLCRYPLGRHPPRQTPPPPGRHPSRQTPPSRTRSLQRTVRILLECILVLYIIFLIGVPDSSGHNPHRLIYSPGPDASESSPVRLRSLLDPFFSSLTFHCLSFSNLLSFCFSSNNLFTRSSRKPPASKKIQVKENWRQ